MNDVQERLAQDFESERKRLRSIAYRMLGSAADADDALQEAWLHISRADSAAVENFAGWCTTIVARVCLDRLKRRKAHKEELTPEDPRASLASNDEAADPEREALLADSLGAALLVVLDTLSPVERVAFVLHDTFDVPFADIAKIVEKTPEAARQLASRARRRVRSAAHESKPRAARGDDVVRAFLEASRTGDLQALIMLLHPQAALRADAAAVAMGFNRYFDIGEGRTQIAGAERVANAFSGRAQAAEPARINLEPAAVWIHNGAPRVAFLFTIDAQRIVAIDLIAGEALSSLVIER